MNDIIPDGAQIGAQGADYLARVEALAPLVQSSAAAIEHDRRLPPALVDAMMEAGLFRMLLPRPFGGAELDPPSFIRVVEALAKLDGSTAWILCQTGVTAMTAARLDPDAAHAIWGDTRGIVAWGPSTDARAVTVDGGYRVSGSFAFASGCWYATWLGGDCAVVTEDGMPRRRPDGSPETRRVLFPASSARMRDVWRVVGLRGTGSDGYEVSDLFVPHSFTLSRVDAPGERRYFGRLYDVSIYSMFASGFAALSLGLARSLLDSFIALATEKTPRGFKHRLRDDAVTQAEIGYAEARWRAARMYLMGTLEAAWRGALARGEVTLDDRMAIRLAATYVIRQAKEIADTAFDAAGTTAVFTANPFERRFRDIHTVAQQLQGRKAHFQTVGRYLLGIEGELGWL